MFIILDQIFGSIFGSIFFSHSPLPPSAPPHPPPQKRRMVIYCNVRGCRHAHTHVTQAHRCGRCSRYGHGVVECGTQIHLDLIPHSLPFSHEFCRVLDCPWPSTHTTESHHCPDCDARGRCVCVPAPPVAGTIPTTSTAPPLVPPLPLPLLPHLPAATPPVAPPRLEVLCPICKVKGGVGQTVYTGADCVVCMEAGPCVLFSGCSHAVVCRLCAARLSSS